MSDDEAPAPGARRARSALALPFQPLLATLRSYDRRKLRSDLAAGLTVAAVEVPQAMAYAVVAGVPPQCGLYTSIVQGALAAAFGSSEHLATGPTNTQSLLVAAVVSRVVAHQGEAADPALYLQRVFALTLLKGLLQLGFAAARMGALLRYVSQSVVVGFTAGAGVLIAIGQIPNLLGLSRSGASMPPGVPGALRDLAGRLDQVNPLAIGIGAPLQYAIFVGIFLNVALYLRQASRLHLSEMRSAPGGAFEEHPLRDAFGRERVLFLQVEGGLFFGLADELRDHLARVLQSGADVVVLRLKRTQMVDGTILLALEEFVLAMRRQHRHVLLCGLSPGLLTAMGSFGLLRLVGEENVFPSAPGIFSSARRALARAEQIVGSAVEGEAREASDAPGPR